MKNLISKDLKLKKYKSLALVIISVTTVYIISDILEWYIHKNEFVLGFNHMPLYRRILTELYILFFGYGGFKLLKLDKKSWYILIISMTSIFPSLFIIPKVWGVIYYTNWIEGFPFFVWYLSSVIMVIFLIIKRKDFGVSNWIGRLSIILLINIAIRLLHEMIIFNIANP